MPGEMPTQAPDMMGAQCVRSARPGLGTASQIVIQHVSKISRTIERACRLQSRSCQNGEKSDGKKRRCLL